MSSIELAPLKGTEVPKINLKEKWLTFRQEQLDPCLRKHLPNLAVLAMPGLTIVAAMRGEKIWGAMFLLSCLIGVARAGHRPPKSAA
jgi:hypothetical protein